MSKNIFTSDKTMRSVQEVIIYSLVLEAFFISLFPVVAEISLLIGFLFFLYKWKFKADFHYKKTKFFWPITVFTVCGLISITGSPDPGFSFYNFYNLVGVYLITYIMVTQNVDEYSDVKKIMYALAWSMTLVIGYGFFQYIFGISTADMKWVDGEAFPELRKRVFATWENPNILAAYLDIVICVLLGLFAKMNNKSTRIYLAMFMVASLACLAMTYARGALLTIAVIIGCYGILKDRRILLTLILVAGGVLALDPVLLERMQTAFLVADTSSEMRIAMWESTVQMIMDHPLLGIGWGAYWMVYPLYDTYIVDGSVTLVHAHNIYLNYWAEIGLIGGTAFLWYFFKTMGLALFNKRVLPDTLMEGLLLGLGLALVSVALNGVTDDVLFNIPSSMLLWLLCGLAYAIRSLGR